MKLALSLLLLLGAAAPAAAAPPRHLFVIGDSLAESNRPYLKHQLRGWKIDSDFNVARSAKQTARDLRDHARQTPLPPVINVSSGTGDDPEHPETVQRAVRRVMRIAGPNRCVVWENVWRLRLEEPTFDTINFVLGGEDAARDNLRVIDWHAMVEEHNDWLIDLVHVNPEGNRARAAAVASEVRLCRQSLKE
jgi:hypothetical protein